MRPFAPIALATAGALLLAGSAQSKPEYAARENKACGYCHVNSGGGGARNPRGVYYAMHSHTFAGYDEEKVMGTAATQKKTGAPSFKAEWKADAPKDSQRLAVADVAGDKKPRILLLDGGNKLTVYKLTGAALEKEDTLDLGDGAKGFVVGRFAKNRPAMVAVPGAIYYRDGDKYVRKAAPDLKEITGTVRFADGTEDIFFFAGGPPQTWTVDLTGDKLLADGEQLVAPDQAAGVYSELVAHLPADTLAQLGAPEGTQKIGMVGFFDPRGANALYSVLPMQDKDGGHIIIAGPDAIGPGAQGGGVKPLWTSPDISGRILDVALGMDPRTGKTPGIYVLHTSGEKEADRTVEFFALD